MTIQELKAIRERITERRDEAVSMIQGAEHLEAATAKAEAASLNWVLDIVLPRPPQPRFKVEANYSEVGNARIYDERTQRFPFPNLPQHKAEAIAETLNEDWEARTHL